MVRKEFVSARECPYIRQPYASIARRISEVDGDKGRKRIECKSAIKECARLIYLVLGPVRERKQGEEREQSGQAKVSFQANGFAPQSFAVFSGRKKQKAAARPNAKQNSHSCPSGPRQCRKEGHPPGRMVNAASIAPRALVAATVSRGDFAGSMREARDIQRSWIPVEARTLQVVDQSRQERGVTARQHRRSCPLSMV